MFDKLEQLSDFPKFLILVILYTGYLTWWASGVTSTIGNNTEHIRMQETTLIEHIRADSEITMQTITLSANVRDISAKVNQHDTILTGVIEQHAKCSAIMDAMLRRLDRMESDYHAERNSEKR